jgi:hypothetical protein
MNISCWRGRHKFSYLSGAPAHISISQDFYGSSDNPISPKCPTVRLDKICVRCGYRFSDDFHIDENSLRKAVENLDGIEARRVK